MDRKRTYVCQGCYDEDSAAQLMTDSERDTLRRGYANITSEDIARVVSYAGGIISKQANARRLGVTVDDTTSAALELVARSLGESDSESVDGWLWDGKRVDRGALRRYAVRRAIGHLVTTAARASERFASLDSIASDDERDAALATLARSTATAFDSRDSVYADANRSRGVGFDSDTLETLESDDSDTLRAFDNASANYAAPLGRPAVALRAAATDYIANAPASAISSRLAAIAMEDTSLLERPYADPGTASEGSSVGVPLLRYRERPRVLLATPNSGLAATSGASTRGAMLRRSAPAAARVPFHALTNDERGSEGALVAESKRDREARAQHAALASTRALRSAVAALESATSDEEAREAAERVRALRATGATTVPTSRVAESGVEGKFDRKQ